MTFKGLSKGSFRRPQALSLALTTTALLCIPGLGAAASAWKVSPFKVSKAKNPVLAEQLTASLQEGRVLYERECGSCHGSKGKGDGPAGAQLGKPIPDLTTADAATQSDGELFVKITTGRRPMPSYERSMTDIQRWHVVNFLRTLAPPAKPKPKLNAEAD